MTAPSGGLPDLMAPKPYPWQQKRSLDRELERARIARWLAIAATLLGALLSLLSLITLPWAWVGYQRLNDGWRRRPLIIIGTGAVLTLVTFRPAQWWRQWADLGSDGGPSVVELALVSALGPALIMAGLAAAGFCYAAEWQSHRYLDPTGRTWLQRWKMARSVKNLRSGRGVRGELAFGMIIDDAVPWRTPRRGLLVGRPAVGLGHGCIVGESASDTTITAATTAHQALLSGASVVYLDCHGSAESLARARAVAAARGADFASFDVGVGAVRSTWYDPLGWSGSPAEKAAALLTALSAARAAENSRSSSVEATVLDETTRAWTELQFGALEEFGLFPGESRFDFLLDTCDPARLRDRIDRLRQGTGEDHARYATWEARLRPYRREQLTGLAEDLVTLINAAGPRLRPSHTGETPINLAGPSAGTGLAYLGLAAASDAPFVRTTLINLAVRDLSALALERAGQAATPLLILIDGAGTLGAGIDLIDDLIIAADETPVWIWPVASSMDQWPKQTLDSLTTDGATVIMHRTTEQRTAERLCAAAGEIPMLGPEPYASDNVALGRLLSDHQRGELVGELTAGPLLKPDDLLRLDAHDAYACFTAREGLRQSATVDRRQSSRVQEDVVMVDLPKVRIVPPPMVITPPAVDDSSAPTFADLVAPAAGLADARAELLPPSEARERRMEEYRSRNPSPGAPSVGASLPYVSPAPAQWWQDDDCAAEPGGTEEEVEAAIDDWADQWEPVDAGPVGVEWVPVEVLSGQRTAMTDDPVERHHDRRTGQAHESSDEVTDVGAEPVDGDPSAAALILGHHPAGGGDSSTSNLQVGTDGAEAAVRSSGTRGDQPLHRRRSRSPGSGQRPGSPGRPDSPGGLDGRTQ